MKLTVLAGAKEGTKIPLKKREFIIGRSSECALRAASDAISRRHCVLTRKESLWTVRDLGSRNGTFVNDVRIEGETTLRPGDELAVGPLRFRVDPSEKSSNVSVCTSTEETVERDASNVAESSQSILQDPGDSASIDDEITRWLLDPQPDARSTRETTSFRMDDTNAFGINGKPAAPSATAAHDAPPASDSSLIVGEETDTRDSEVPGKEDAPTSGILSSLRGKGKQAKKEAGKLPPRPTQMAKDSCEAAADVLREMSRRR